MMAADARIGQGHALGWVWCRIVAASAVTMATENGVSAER
jgi:hypothetical protein